MVNKSLYIHIPFCASKCLYCGFYSTLYNERLASSCIDVICGQLNSAPGKFDTIYIGGGTPTVLDVKLLDKLLSALEKRADSAAEFTIEANPESATSEKLSLLLDKGVNRISIGAQSFDDAKLEKLGRVHDGARARSCIENAYKKGFKNISIDLIFGVRGETLKDWKKDLKAAVSFPARHISCYALDCKKLEAEGGVAELYEYAMDYLPKDHFKQYEISNFAKFGLSCRHNLNYWDNGPYMGLGPSAVSYIDGKREENMPDILEYIKKAPSGRSVTVFSEKLSGIASAKETAAVKIRTMEGIALKWFKDKTGLDFLKLEEGALPRLLEERLIRYVMDKGVRSGVALTRKGILFCDIVSGAFL